MTRRRAVTLGVFAPVAFLVVWILKDCTCSARGGEPCPPCVPPACAAPIAPTVEPDPEVEAMKRVTDEVRTMRAQIQVYRRGE